nr:hypothetical protein [Candidatus Sigynarchaeota archaeon]
MEQPTSLASAPIFPGGQDSTRSIKTGRGYFVLPAARSLHNLAASLMCTSKNHMNSSKYLTC